MSGDTWPTGTFDGTKKSGGAESAESYKPDVSVVLPTFNEAETIVDVVRSAYHELDSAGYDVEVVVVDDDSPDETWRIAREEFEDASQIDVVRRTDDQGLSSAVLDGLRLSLGRFAVVMDADGQHPPERLPALVDALKSGVRDGGEPKDVVVGSRHVDGGSIEGWPVHRKLISRVATSLASIVPAARELSDPMSGFFAVDRKRVDDEVLEASDPHGYKILLEIMTHTPDVDVGEVPITFRDRQAGESKLTLDEQVRFVEHILGLWLLSTGLDRVLDPPLAVRSLEAGATFGAAFLLLTAGLIIGDVDGAFGAGLIAASGGAIVLGAQRLSRTGESWIDTVERFSKS